MKEYDYINDSKYARIFARTKFNSGRSSNFIRAALIKKGIKPAMIAEAISETKPTEEAEIETACSIARKKYDRKSDWNRNSRRIGGLLARRGFGFSIIEKTLRILNGEKKDED